MNHVVAFARCIDLLGAETPSMSTGAKYLLLRSIFVFGGKPSEDTREQLASKIGMPVSALIKAHDELERLGLAESSGTPGFSRRGPTVTTQGSFRRGFKLNLEAIEAWLGEPRMMSTGARARKMLQAILLWSEPVESGAMIAGMNLSSGPSLHLPLPEGIRLSFANRLLMGVLWAHSDSFGIIWNCRLDRLSKLAGMSEGQVKSQLGKLAKAGVISHRVQDANGEALFPKLPGAILLNQYPGLIEVARSAERAPLVYSMPTYELADVQLLLNVALPSPYPGIGLDARVYVQQVFEARLGLADCIAKGGVGRMADQVEELLPVGLRSGEARRFALYKLCDYATQILRKAGPTIGAPCVDDPMVQRIHDEITLPKWRDDPVSLGAGAIFMFYAHRLACMARQVKEFKGGSRDILALLPGPPATMRVLMFALDHSESGGGSSAGVAGTTTLGRWPLNLGIG